MSRTDLLNHINTEVFFTNPLGRLNSVTIKKESVDKLMELQEHGWKFIKPMVRIDEGCVACES